MNTASTTEDYTHHRFLTFMVSPRYRLMRHLLLFSFIFALDWLNDRPKEAWPIRMFTFGTLMGLVYVNIYLLVPRFLFKQRYVAYVLSIVGVTVAVFLLFVWKDSHWPPTHGHPLQLKASSFFGVFFFVLVLFASSAAIKLFQRTVVDYYRINQLEKYTLHAELERLKSQINPHFLFNTLNNVNVLTRKDPEKASEVLHKLSDLLRYQLYDSAHNRIPLTGDVAFLDNLLNLEKIRRDRFEFSIREDGRLQHIQVPPFLFVPFVENAVKHNADADAGSYVDIRFWREENRLLFECSNSKPAIPSVPQNKTGGLGLRNIRRRLQLLYPDTHTLTILDQTDTYTIHLSIPIA